MLMEKACQGQAFPFVKYKEMVMELAHQVIVSHFLMTSTNPFASNCHCS
jgi:hypothetical protein